MEIKLAKERILLLKDQMTAEDAEKIAWKNKSNAFGAFHQVSNFLSRPTDEDFKLTYKEHRYLPFWNIAGTANYTYDRTVEHEWPTGGPEVMSLTLQEKNYTADNSMVSITVTEHCKQKASEEMFVDGLTGVRKAGLKNYVQFSSEEMQRADIEKLAENNIVIPPHARASALVREIASKMIQNIEADQILEENVAFQHIDLYYRSVFAFKYHWASKNKDSVVEIDGLTGQVTFSQTNFQQLVGNVFDYDFLFDIGKDAAGMVIPGGTIAIKLAKKYMDVTKQMKKS